MSKFSEISDEFKELFFEQRDQTSIPNWVEFTLYANNQMKDLYQVRKFDELVEILTSVNIAVLVNEDIFFKLTEDQQLLAVKEMLHGIVVDNENDKLSIEKFNFTTYSGLLEKVGSEPMIAYKESVESLFRAKLEQEDKVKKAKKEKASKK